MRKNELNWVEKKHGTILECPMCGANDQWEVKKWVGRIYFKCLAVTERSDSPTLICNNTMNVRADMKNKGGIWSK